MQIDEKSQAAQEAEALQRLSVFAESLTKKRKEFITYRRKSGIEKVWDEDEDFYYGVDDANRGDVYRKPYDAEGPLTYDYDEKPTGSNLFLNITQFYVDAAAARVIDMLTPVNDRPFKFSATPIATTKQTITGKVQQAVNGESKDDFAKTLLDAMRGKSPTDAAPQTEQQPSTQAGPPPEMMSALMGGQQSPDAALGAMMQPPVSPEDQAEKAKSEAQAAADKAAQNAEDQVWDWLEESGWTRELRECIESMAMLGAGVLKGPFPYNSVSRVAQRGELGMELVVVDEVKPGTKFISPRNLYPDPSCGNDIHNGSGVFEKDYITGKQLQEMLGRDYLDTQIKAVLKEGPNKKYADERMVKDNEESDRYEIWYYHGMASYEDLQAAGCDCQEDESIPVVITMVNDRIIKATLNVLDSGAFPYDVLVWQKMTDSPWGRGISRLVRECQRMLNAALRNMLDNAGLAAGPQIILRDGVITPLDGEWNLTPRKMWAVDNNSDMNSVAHAITSVQIPSFQAEAMNIIKFAMESAERVTSMPLLMQGSQGQATETVGGMTMLQNNANTVLRRIARTFDDRITPHLKRYYEWLMMYSDNEEAKGDFQINALGSTSLYERDAANQFINQIGPMVMNPAYGLSPARWAEEMLKANKIDPKRLELTEEEKQKMAAAAQQQQPNDPRIAGQIQVAQIRTEGELKKAEITQQSDIKEIELKEQIATAQLQLKMDEAELQRRHEKELMQMKYDMEIMQFSRESGLTLEQTKASLAETALKLKTQKELSLAAMQADLHKHHNPQVTTPPTEPVGRAENGAAFYQ